MVAHHFETGATVSISGRVVASASDHLFFNREVDLNGDGDSQDLVWHRHDLETGGTRNLRLAAESSDCGPEFVRGDSNDDGSADISDVVVKPRRQPPGWRWSRWLPSFA
jgi:hypothetical protein